MNYLKVSLGIFMVLAASRFIPHPPNFTSLIALSFYVPAILGLRYLSALVICFIITDMFIGFHGLTLFTWGSVIIIGLISKFFTYNIYFRVSGAFLGTCIFFLITNFGVWLLGSYGYSLNGLLSSYWFAIPFFGNTILSTLIYALIIELLFKIYKTQKIIQIN